MVYTLFLVLNRAQTELKIDRTSCLTRIISHACLSLAEALDNKVSVTGVVVNEVSPAASFVQCMFVFSVRERQVI